MSRWILTECVPVIFGASLGAVAAYSPPACSRDCAENISRELELERRTVEPEDDVDLWPETAFLRPTSKSLELYADAYSLRLVFSRVEGAP
jgi:hypothetical protein